VKAVVCREVSAHRNSDYRAALTFNVFNLTLDFASGTAKLENELDTSAAGEVTVPLDDFLALVGCDALG
jgi:hypothetical protein